MSNNKLSMTGQITFDPEVEGKESMRDGAMNLVMLAGSLSVQNGVVVFDLLADYHICYRGLPVVVNGVLVSRTGGRKKLWLVSRPVVDREKYPNWPEPEPVLRSPA